MCLCDVSVAPEPRIHAPNSGRCRVLRPEIGVPLLILDRDGRLDRCPQQSKPVFRMDDPSFLAGDRNTIQP